MKKLFIVAGLLLHSITSFGQNPSWILAPNYYNEVLVPNIQTLPIASVANGNTTNSPLDGYDGAAASGGQNIISDQQNKIVFFIIDQYIYDSKGRLIDVFSARSEDGTYMEATGLISEIAIVPVPEDCNSFYLLSTAENPNAGVSFAEGYVSKLTVNYDGAGNLLPGSGLEVVDIFNCAIKGVSFKELIGPDYNAVNNVHDERPLIAISQKNSIGDQFVFVQNGARVFRLKVGSNAITFDNYFLDLHTIFPGRLFLPVTRFREEMEIIQLNSGNYRIAFPQEYTVISTGIDYKSIVVFDLDNTGILIANSQRCIDYINDNSILPDDKLLIKGIELSPDGSKLYVAHNKQGIYQSSLDYFDLNIASPSPIVISALNLFALSQIESIVDNSSANGYAILIPSQNNIAKISNSDNPTFPADLSYTYLSVVNNATNPFPADVLSLNTAHSLRLLQDQIDYSDYSFIDPNVYDEDTYDATVNATWVANPSGPGTGNPIIYDNGSIAYIKNELRIKAGTTITISGLTIHFAPGARLVIENGEGGQQGGKLILNNTILTNENRCDKDKMWLGVEVWGNQELSQGTISSSTQGRLIMLNNSRIEHAQIGVLLSKRNSYIEPIPVLPGSCLDNILPQFVSIVLPFSFSDTYNGGVIQTTASQFLGNQRGVWMRKYLATSGANNLSFIRNTDFIWNGLLKENLSLQAHITFDVVKGIQIKGSDFLNNTPNLFSVANQGIGILSRQSQFYVSPYCTSIGPIGVPCPVANTIKSTFLDLRYGIHVTNSDAFTYSVDQSIFDNCVYGIYNIGTDNERITSNIFKVREANYFTAGGAIFNSDAYKIQENEFFEKDDISINNGDGISYGLVINSSGTSHNEVYNNDFHNLRVGGQSEKINGTTVINPNDPLATGLQWKCNNFYNQIYLADLGVNGIIDYHQGYLGSTSLNGAVLVSARNTFSLYNEDEIALPEHDIMLYPGSQFLNYVHLANTTHIPDNVDLAVIPSQQVFMGVNVSATPNMCPSLLNVPKIILQQKMAETKNELQVLKNKLDGGNTTDLLNLIASGGNPNTIKTTLLDKSPFLTDEVLLNYLSSGAASAMKKDVLIANSHLTDPVLTAVNNSNLSNGTKNQIFAAQNGISEREKLYNEISFVDGEYQYAYNDLLSQMLLDTSETATYDEAIDFLNQLDDEKSKKTLLDLYVLKEDFTSATNLRNSLATELLDSDFFDLHDVKTQIRIVSAVDVALNDQPQLAASLEELDNFAVNTQVQARAKVLLEMLNGSSEVPDFLPLSDYGAKMMQFQQEESEPYTFFQVVSIYPNPSNGIVNFDLPEIEEGSLTITIFELSGKEVYSATFQNTNGDRVDLSHLQKGTYLAKIAIENKYTEAQLIQLR